MHLEKCVVAVIATAISCKVVVDGSLSATSVISSRPSDLCGSRTLCEISFRVSFFSFDALDRHAFDGQERIRLRRLQFGNIGLPLALVPFGSSGC